MFPLPPAHTQVRPILQRQHPHASFSELGQMLGKGWQETNELGRAKYLQQYEATKKARKDRKATEAAASAAAAAVAASGSLKKLPGPHAGGGGDGDAPPRAHGKQSDAATIEDLRRQLKEARAELRKSAAIMEKLQLRVVELRRARHLSQKREKRREVSKDKCCRLTKGATFAASSSEMPRTTSP